MIKSRFSFCIAFSPGFSRLYLIGRNTAWKWPRCLPKGDIAVRLFHLLYLFIICSILILISSSSLEVWNCLSKCLLVGLLVISLILAVQARISFAVDMVAPQQILSLTSFPPNAVFFTCLN